VQLGRCDRFRWSWDHGRADVGPPWTPRLSRVAACDIDAGALLIDMSSSDAPETRALIESPAARGVRVLDAPVSEGVAGAGEGALTIMVGVAQSDLPACRPAPGRARQRSHPYRRGGDDCSSDAKPARVA
jgi:6-phosphogluconate dehydrogenase (decarboxylating)